MLNTSKQFRMKKIKLLVLGVIALTMFSCKKTIQENPKPVSSIIIPLTYDYNCTDSIDIKIKFTGINNQGLIQFYSAIKSYTNDTTFTKINGKLYFTHNFIMQGTSEFMGPIDIDSAIYTFRKPRFNGIGISLSSPLNAKMTCTFNNIPQLDIITSNGINLTKHIGCNQVFN